MKAILQTPCPRPISGKARFLTNLTALGVVLAFAPAAFAASSELADAVESGELAQVQTLLSQKVDINSAQVDGMTALHWAVHNDNTELATKLLSLGANPSTENNYGISPLYLACVNGNAEVAKRLLEKGADPNTIIRGGESVLMTASRTGNLDTVKALLDAGADVNHTERRGQTALMWASAEGHLEIATALIDAGADTKVTLPRSGYTAFFFAIREGHADLVHMFLDIGEDVNLPMNTDGPKGGSKTPGGKLPQKNTTPLLLAVENGHYDLAIEMIDRGADPNDMSSGVTILHALTWIRKPDIGESASGAPPPRGSGKRNSEQFIRDIVARGANVNARLSTGRRAGGGNVSAVGATPFFQAADRADLAYMKLLVELGADPFIPNEDGATALTVAAGVGSKAPEEEAGSEAECLAAVKYLVSLGAEINIVDDNGETAMHGAALKNIPSMVYYLNEMGADINLWNNKNSEGWTPLLIAEGYRPGNFKPSFETVDAITEVMHMHGVSPPTGPKPKHTNYAD